MCFAFVKGKSETVVDSIYTNVGSLSNKKIGWGIKRNNNHEQPDLGAENRKILEKNGGIAVGNKEEKTVYLTFDEGYEAGYTAQILDVLKENEVKATFFITAHYVNTKPELVKRMIDEGHIVGNHTVNHKSMPDLTEEQIKEEERKRRKRAQNRTYARRKYEREKAEREAIENTLSEAVS